MSFQFAKLGDLAEINPRVPKELATDTNREVDFVPMSQLSEQGVIESSGSRLLGEVMKGYNYFANGDVVVAKITPCMENGKAAFVHDLPHGVAFGSTEFHVLRPSAQLDGRYLFYMLWNDAYRHIAERNMTGTAGQKRVPKSFLERFTIPLPPLSEQKRIADILDKADAIRRKRQEAINDITQFPVSTFFDMFGDPRTNPNAWKGTQLKRLVAEGDKVNYGVVQPGGDYTGGVPIVRVGDLHNLRVSADGLKHIDPEIEQQYARSRLVGDEILVACVGSIGLVALADDRLKGFNIARPVARIRCGKSVDRQYLAAYFATPAIQSYFTQSTRTVSQPTLNIKQIEETNVLVPPIELQREYSTVIASYLRSLQRQETARESTTDLFNSLVQRAFKGEL